MTRPLTFAAGAALSALLLTAAPAAAQTRVSQPGENQIQEDAGAAMTAVGVGKGVAVRLPRPAKSVFIANPKVADVNPVSNQMVYVFGKSDGETTLYAVDGADRVIYATTVRVGNNIAAIQDLLRLAAPTATIQVDVLNAMIVLTGFVASPQEVEDVGRLVQRFVGSGQTVVNKLQTRTPYQVHLKVKFAEVSRDVVKQLGVNFQTADATGGFQFFASRGRDWIANDGSITLPADGSTTLYSAGRLFGMDIQSAIDALEQEGLITVLAEPTLTSLSGEKASFLAGGEFPIPVSEENGRIAIEFKQFGVSLEFMPVVHASNRISIKVKPEVSQITNLGAVRLNNISVPGVSTRRAETFVELGSGQSFVIAGLLQNQVTQDVTKMPGLGSLPVLGALFKSDRFRRQETELVIVVTPYVVKPMQPDQVRLPTDGFKAPTDFQRYFLGKTFQEGVANTAPAPVQAAPAPGGASAGAAAPGLQFDK
jgi:pilus assembly protein CpaC